MNSIRSNFNYSTDPGLIVLLIITLIILFIVITKIISKYKSTYTVYEKVDTVNKKLIKLFHLRNSENLQLIEKDLDFIRRNKTTVSFTEYITIQEKFKDIINHTLEYEYLMETERQGFLSLQQQLTINFHNMSMDNLNAYSEELDNLQAELVTFQDIIRSNEIFNSFKFSLDIFLVDYQIFMKFCQQNSKNAIILKMKNFNPLSEFELKSFEKTFSHIAHKRVSTKIDIFEIYLMTVELFKKNNVEVLTSIHKITLLKHKIEDERKKIGTLEKRIDYFIESLSKLQDELTSLHEETINSTAHNLSLPLLANLKL